MWLPRIAIRTICFLMVCTYIASPSPAASADPATIALVASTAAEVVSLFDSGADPSKVQIAQSHTILRFMHDRMDTFSYALSGIMRQLDDLPKAIRRESKHGKNDYDRALFVGFVQRLYVDFDYLAEGRIPSHRLLDRLNRLSEISDLFRTGSEDLNLPYILLGMQVEKALSYGMGKEDEWHGIGRSKGIKKLYANRIASMLDPRRYDSLVSSLDNLEAAIAESKESLLEELQNAKIEYETSTKELYIPCTIGYYLYVLDIDDIMRRAKVPLSKVASAHELPLIMQIHDTYKLMIERARYALDILNGAHQTNVTVSREPADFLSAPASVSEIKQIIERSLLAHASRIEKAKGAWQKKNDHVMFISREYTKQAESPMGCK